MRPSILGFFTVGMTTLSMLSVSCVLYFAGSGVKRVLVVLSGLRWSWFYIFYIFIFYIMLTVDINNITTAQILPLLQISLRL